MFMELVDYPIESRALHWQAQQVVRDFGGEPHLLLRLRLGGTRFPHRAQMPFAAVDGRLRAAYVEIARDERTVAAYFGQRLPEGGLIEFGYGSQTLLRFPERFADEAVDWLDPGRLSKQLRFYEAFFASEPASRE